MAPLVLVNTVGLTSKLLPLAPRLAALASAGWARPLRETFPAVTCSVQASILTGQPPSVHGIVGNGWLFRDTGEVRFWQQSNRLIQAEPFYQTARRLWPGSRPFRCAKLFWWFNQGADVDLFVTPKPHYGADGSKVFGILGAPEGLTEGLEKKLGPFPFHTFWGPMAGLPCTQWIARCAAEIVQNDPPDLTLVYLPHLDYDTQRFGPDKADMARLVRELDESMAPLLDAARSAGAAVWVVNECQHVPVSRPILINRALRQAGLLIVRPGPFGEVLETFQSRAFAVCDHQHAHVYLRRGADVEAVRGLVAGLPGVARVLAGAERAELGIDHPNAGELVALADSDAWFAYYYWLEDRQAPDYAATVDIHRKPGYDPCELLFDPRLRWPKGRALLRLAQKRLGFRYLMDVVPLDARLVKGSHGLPSATPEDRPLWIGSGASPGEEVGHTSIRASVLHFLGLLDKRSSE